MLSKKEIQEILVDIKADGMPDFQQKVEKTTARMGELREQIKEVKEGLSILRCCELLSNFVSLISETTGFLMMNTTVKL